MGPFEHGILWNWTGFTSTKLALVFSLNLHYSKKLSRYRCYRQECEKGLANLIRLQPIKLKSGEGGQINCVTSPPPSGEMPCPLNIQRQNLKPLANTPAVAETYLLELYLLGRGGEYIKYYATVFCFVSSSIAEALVCLTISKMRKISYRITVLVSTTKYLVCLVNLTSERTKGITPKTKGGMCNHW